MSSVVILPKVAAQTKKHTFVGALDFQIKSIRSNFSDKIIELRLLSGANDVNFSNSKNNYADPVLPTKFHSNCIHLDTSFYFEAAILHN